MGRVPAQLELLKVLLHHHGNLRERSLTSDEAAYRCSMKTILFCPTVHSGMAGGHINGRAGLEGTMLGPSIFSGRVARGWAAHAAGHGRGFVCKANRV
jgi:predicted oxidoreductase